MSTPTPPPILGQQSTTDVADTRKESLITYPSLFPIKVMGVKADGFVHAITVTATSREQLDELYRTLSTHPMVKVVL